MWTAQIGQEVRSSARGTLWSFESGRVAPYGKADKLAIAPFEVDAAAATEPAPLKDLDVDGRVDLLTYAPFFGVFKQSCGVIETFDAFGPRLLQHSLADGARGARGLGEDASAVGTEVNQLGGRSHCRWAAADAVQSTASTRLAMSLEQPQWLSGPCERHIATDAAIAAQK